jgi:hypothetical protein
MTRKLWMVAAVVAIALTPLIEIGTAEATAEDSGAVVFMAEAFMAVVFTTGTFMTGRNFGASV